MIKEISSFADAMQAKIDKNAFKNNWPDKNEKGERSWKTCSIDFLIEKLEEEHFELIDAISVCQQTPFWVAGNSVAERKILLDNIKNEAADVGNIAMMIADRMGALSQE